MNYFRFRVLMLAVLAACIAFPQSDADERGTGDDLAAILFSRITSIAFDGGEGDDQFYDIINAIETISNSGFE